MQANRTPIDTSIRVEGSGAFIVVVTLVFSVQKSGGAPGRMRGVKMAVSVLSTNTSVQLLMVIVSTIDEATGDDSSPREATSPVQVPDGTGKAAELIVKPQGNNVA